MAHALTPIFDIVIRTGCVRAKSKKEDCQKAIHDKQGHTPLHISLINKNMSGSLALADEIVQRKNGFSYGVRNDIKMKNAEGKVPLDIARELDVPKSDKKKLKVIKKWIKEHIKPKGRFDYASYAEDDDD